jgi:hypothetical protein
MIDPAALETIAMIEFSLSIDLGKKERVVARSAESMPVDRAFVARALIDLAAKIQAGKDPRGIITDDTGLDVGNWKFKLLPLGN